MFCRGCSTIDPKAFDDDRADYCVRCSEENEAMRREAYELEHLDECHAELN